MVDFIPPTLEEYQTASEFARFRYKYGMIITFLCWVALLFLIFYMVTNIEEMKQINDPMVYAVRQNNLECHCTGPGTIDFYVNSSTRWLHQTTIEQSQDKFSKELEDWIATQNQS